MERPDFFTLKNGEKVKLPFSKKEYDERVKKLREVMSKNSLDMIILTSMHNVAYYSGFIYCSFGRPYGCIITQKKISTISANIDASQPWRRSHCDNVIYTDWKRDNFLKAIVSIIGRDIPPKNIGIENDHVTLDMREKIGSIFTFSIFSDISKDLMKLRMFKSSEEISIIKNGARIADIDLFVEADVGVVGSHSFENLDFKKTIHRRIKEMLRDTSFFVSKEPLRT